MPSAKKFYLTTPIYYVNARPHIGHAYSTIVADVIARRHRLLGDDTYFLTGTDEHGQKIERSAAAAGVPPQEFADRVSETFSSLWQRMGITNDDFIRTTSDRHKRGVQKLFATLQANGAIYLDTYTGQYCVSDEAYVDGPPGVVCPDCGNVTETVSESNYYFKLSEYGERVAARIESNELLIQPESRRNEILSFVRGGLKDLSISRTSFKWGIPVPGDEGHVIYVWLDALANYMTAIGYGSDAAADVAKFARYWPADLHLVGKEIIRFHCVYWPAFLMAAGLPLPRSIVANGWLLFEESKMSKSRGNVVRAETILDAFGALCPAAPAILDLSSSAPRSLSSSAEGRGSAFPPEAPQPLAPTKQQQDLFATDVLRYFLLREIPFGQDGSFSFDAMVTRYNADLANGYGNLVSRTLSMVDKYVGGVIPARDEDMMASLAEITRDQFAEILKQFETLNFGDFLRDLWGFLRWVDTFVTGKAPWKAPDDIPKDALLQYRSDVLYTASDCVRVITALLYPILPYATASVWSQLGLGDIELAAKNGELKDLKWGGLKPGTKLGPLAPIFPRADKGLIQTMIDTEERNAQEAAQAKLKPVAESGAPRLDSETWASTAPDPSPSTAAAAETAPAAAAPAIPDTPQIAIDDFVKIDLRVAQILVAERIPKADKLLRLEVDLGYERRQILSGIAEWYTPEELIGRRIVVIANLAPRKMRGLESHGMLLAASDGEHGKPVLATFGEEIALGSRVR